MTDKDNEQPTAEETKKRREEQLVAAFKSLAAKGFSKEQAAQQLSAKHAMTVDEVTAVLDQSDKTAKADK